MVLGDHFGIFISSLIVHSHGTDSKLSSTPPVHGSRYSRPFGRRYTIVGTVVGTVDGTIDGTVDRDMFQMTTE